MVKVEKISVRYFDVDVSILKSVIRAESARAIRRPIAVLGLSRKDEVVATVRGPYLNARPVLARMDYQRVIFQPRLIGSVKAVATGRSMMTYRVAPGLGRQLIVSAFVGAIVCAGWSAITKLHFLLILTAGFALVGIGLLANLLMFARSVDRERRMLIEWVERVTTTVQAMCM